MAKQPDPGVIRFVDRIEDSVAVTVITVAEIRYGIAVLPADAEIAAARRRAGKLISQAVGIIAAICRHHEVALVTRNADDCAGTGIVVVNPWDR